MKKIINIFSTKNINVITLIITIIIFLILNLIINNISKINLSEIDGGEIIAEKNNDNKNNKENKSEENGIENEQNLNWYIEIPSINLKAPIVETTDINILNKAVGHFEETPLTLGNIGLAGHNRGYEKNYFENLKDVKKGDEVKYKYNNFEKIYIIDKIEIIKNTNWDYLENTQENKITLITCVENEPDYRRCVQATEK